MKRKLPAQKKTFTAVIQREGKWWLGWIEEIPGVNGQGRTRKEFLANLKSALREALTMNRDQSRKGFFQWR